MGLIEHLAIKILLVIIFFSDLLHN